MCTGVVPGARAQFRAHHAVLVAYQQLFADAVGWRCCLQGKLTSYAVATEYSWAPRAHACKCSFKRWVVSGSISSSCTKFTFHSAFCWMRLVACVHVIG